MKIWMFSFFLVVFIIKCKYYDQSSSLSVFGFVSLQVYQSSDLSLSLDLGLIGISSGRTF
jgi:hypothetical protein